MPAYKTAIQKTWDQPDLIYWIWLSERLGAGCDKYSALLAAFGTPKAVYRAQTDELTAFEPKLEKRQLAALADKDLQDAANILRGCQTVGCGVLTMADPAYPLSLRHLHNPPLLLYFCGDLPDFYNKLCIAVVGTRQMSEYGKKIAYKIAYELAHAGAIVVSGMALGIDGVAGAAALAGGGNYLSTVAVLGNGLDSPYPPEHASLFTTLKHRGTVFSEYPPGTKPLGRHFPMRNRLIVGLCAGVLVVEAGESSGAMITARVALEEGRDVFAVPGNVDAPGAVGPNALLQGGARVALTAEDILSVYRELYRHSIAGAEETNLLSCSDYDPRVLANQRVFARTQGGFTRIPAGASLEESRGIPAVKQNKKKETSSSAEALRSPTAKEKQHPGESKPNIKAVPPQESDNPSAEKVTELPKENKRVETEKTAENGKTAFLNEDEKTVLAAIPEDQTMTLETLGVCGLDTSRLLVALSLLEIHGFIHTLPGGKYARS